MDRGRLRIVALGAFFPRPFGVHYAVSVFLSSLRDGQGLDTRTAQGNKHGSSSSSITSEGKRRPHSCPYPLLGSAFPCRTPPPRTPTINQAEIPGVRGIPPTQHHAENLTCCALNSPSTMMGMGTDSSSHLTVGTSGDAGVGVGGASPPSLLQVDPATGLRLLKAVGLPREAGVTSMARG